MRRVLELVNSGEVVQLRPSVLTVKAAAIFCACSASLLNSYRAADAKRLLRGEQLVGPAWVRVGYGIRYRVADLEAWLARTSVPFGVMESRRRNQTAEEISA